MSTSKAGLRGMDTVFLQGLQVDALVGVYPAERHSTQPLLLDIALGYDNRAPAASDAVGDAVDYATIAARVREWVAATDYALLETLGEDLAARLLALEGVHAVRLRIDKPDAAAALGCRHVGIELHRERGVR